MSLYLQSIIDQVWDKGLIDEHYPATKIRKDACGAWIIKDHYGNRDSAFGWEIDHIYPQVLLQEKQVPQDLIDHIDNLRPLNWQNNSSKGNDFPVYHASVQSEDNRNIKKDEEREVNKSVRDRLSLLYSKYL